MQPVCLGFNQPESTVLGLQQSSRSGFFRGCSRLPQQRTCNCRPRAGPLRQDVQYLDKPQVVKAVCRNEGSSSPPSAPGTLDLSGWLPLLCSSPALLSLLALPAQAAAVPQLSEGGFSKSSYYVTLGLFLLSVPGAIFEFPINSGECPFRRMCAAMSNHGAH